MNGKLSLLALVLAAIAGCSNTPQQESTADKTEPAPIRRAAAVQAVTASTAQEAESQKLGRLAKGVEGQSVYFAYDDFTIQAKYQPSIQAHAGVLNKMAGNGYCGRQCR